MDCLQDAVPTLDELFRKTTTKPQVYWLPLTKEQALQRQKQKVQEELGKAKAFAR